MKINPNTRVAFIMAAIITANFYLCMVVFRLATLLHVNLAITLTIAGLYILPAIGMFYILYRCISFVPKRPSRHPRRNEKPKQWYWAVRFMIRKTIKEEDDKNYIYKDYILSVIGFRKLVFATQLSYSIELLNCIISIEKYKYQYYFINSIGKKICFKTFVEAVDAAYNEPQNKVSIYSIRRRKPVFIVDVYTDKYVN